MADGEVTSGGSRERCDRVAELVEVTRLPEASVKLGRLLVLLVETSQSDDRKRVSLRVLADPPREFDAVHLRHRDVRDDGIEPRRRLDVSQTVASTPCEQYLSAARLEEGREDLDRIVVVIDDEDGETTEVREIEWARSHHRRLPYPTLLPILGQSFLASENAAVTHG
jgi:hypothetical protein